MNMFRIAAAMTLICSHVLHADNTQPTIPHLVDPEPTWSFIGSTQNPAEARIGETVTITWNFTASGGFHRDSYTQGDPAPPLSPISSNWGIRGWGPISGNTTTFSMTSTRIARNGFTNFYDLKEPWYYDPCDGSHNTGNTSTPSVYHQFVLRPADPNTNPPPGPTDPPPPPPPPLPLPPPPPTSNDQGEAELPGEIVDSSSYIQDPDRGSIPTRSDGYAIIKKTDPANPAMEGVNDVNVEMTHRIVTINSPDARDLEGTLKLEVQPGSVLQDYLVFRINPEDGAKNQISLPFQMHITEPGHVGDGVHDWHAGYEQFDFRRIGDGALNLKFTVTPDKGASLKTASLHLLPVDLAAMPLGKADDLKHITAFI